MKCDSNYEVKTPKLFTWRLVTKIVLLEVYFL